MATRAGPRAAAVSHGDGGQEPTANGASAAALGGAPEEAPDFTSAIYDAITKAFASRNPTQLFCLSWPGTVLEHDRLAWESAEAPEGVMPERSLLRSSQILDQYIPPAPLTQPDGTRVSDRYQQALSQLAPVPNAALIKLQAIVRERLQVEVVREVDGRERTYTLGAWFDYLFGRWADARRDWGDKQSEMRRQLESRYRDETNPDAWWNAYLQWYGDNATGYIARINSRWQQLVAEFPLTEWEDAIAILDTKDGSGLQDAREIMRNAVRPVPYQEGVQYVPTQGVPYDWPLELEPVTKFLDLLADPEAQQMAYETALAQLEQEIFNWDAIVSQIDDEAVQRDIAALNAARSEYTRAQSALINQYTENVVEAVKIVADVMKAREQTFEGVERERDGPRATAEIVDQVKGLARGLAGGVAPAAAIDWRVVLRIGEAFGRGQNSLVAAQQQLIDSGYALAETADRFLNDRIRSSSFRWLPAYVAQLRSKLAAVQRAAADHASAANVWDKYRSTARTEARRTDPNELPEFAADAYPSPLDSPANDRWTTVTVDLTARQLEASSRTNTSFSDMQWGVNLFFGSAGGQYEQSGASFASRFMQSDSRIQIGFLATKVLIDRPWMRAEVLGATRSLFRTTESRLAPERQITAREILEADGSRTIQELIGDYTLPCYPVALLLVKDVTVRVQIQFSKMEEMRDYAKSTQSQGGGFLCFSVSRTETTSSESESMNQYCMAGQFVARAPSPQIIGYWVQFVPPDQSTQLDDREAAVIAQSLGFVGKLQAAHQAGEATDVPVREV